MSCTTGGVFSWGGELVYELYEFCVCLVVCDELCVFCVSVFVCDRLYEFCVCVCLGCII